MAGEKLGRRSFLARSLGVAGGLAAASLAGGGLPAPGLTRPALAAPLSQGGVTVVFWQHEDPRLTALTKELIEQYKARAPNVTIDFNSTPHVDYEPALIAALAGGAGPDVYDIGEWNVLDFIRKGIIDPLLPEAVGLPSHQAAIDLYIAPNVLSGLVVDGQLYGFPLELSNFILYINDDHFKEAGLDPEKDYPRYWNDDFVTVGQKLVQREGDRIVREAYDLPYFDPTWNMLVTTPFFAQNGASVVNQDATASALDTPEALKAFELMTGLITQYKLGDPNAGLTSPTQPAQDFTDGKLSMWQLGPWGRAMMAGTPLENSYRVVPLPQTRNGVAEATVLYSWFWTVNPKTAVREEAWKFAAYLAEDPEFWLKNLGLLQARKGILDTPSAKEFKFIDVILEDQKKGVFMPRTYNFQKVQQAMWKATQRTCQEGMPAAQSLEIAHQEINAALKG